MIFLHDYLASFCNRIVIFISFWTINFSTHINYSLAAQKAIMHKDLSAKKFIIIFSLN